jgi:hypothetical protein
MLLHVCRVRAFECVVAALAAATTLIACGPKPHPCTPPHCPFTAPQAMAMADSQIYYPGATVESRTGTDGSNSVNGEPEDAYITTRLATPATEAQVTAWYQKTLPAAGWTQGGVSLGAPGYSHYPFYLLPPLSPAHETIYVDFRPQSPTASGTTYTLTFAIGTP